jgi:hypothetical protein
MQVLLLVQVWPLRTELTDVVVHGLGCLAGLANVMAHLWVVQDGELTAHTLTLGSGGRLEWRPTLISCAATVCIVSLHFVGSSGRLLSLALCRAADPEVLKRYHDEYAPVRGALAAESRRNFDGMVADQRRSRQRDISLTARVGRTKVGAGIKSVSIRAKRAVGIRPRDRGGSVQIKSSRASASFKKVREKASKSKLGKAISAVSFNRRAYGARRKLGPTAFAANAGGRDPEVGMGKSSTTVAGSGGKGEWSNGRTRRASLIEFKNNMAQELQPMQAPRRAVQFASDAHAGTGNTYMAPQRTRAKTPLT